MSFLSHVHLQQSLQYYFYQKFHSTQSTLETATLYCTVMCTYGCGLWYKASGTSDVWYGIGKQNFLIIPGKELVGTWQWAAGNRLHTMSGGVEERVCGVGATRALYANITNHTLWHTHVQHASFLNVNQCNTQFECVFATLLQPQAVHSLQSAANVFCHILHVLTQHVMLWYLMSRLINEYHYMDG